MFVAVWEGEGEKGWFVAGRDEAKKNEKGWRKELEEEEGKDEEEEEEEEGKGKDKLEMIRIYL